MFKVKRLWEQAAIPKRVHKTDSGLDLHLFSPNSTVVLYPGEYKLVNTGIAIELCHDEFHWTNGLKMTLEATVRPRSGLAANKGLSIVNTPGTIDNGFSGEVMVILINLGNEKIELNHGDKIAQLVVAPVVIGFDLIEVEELGETDRGSKGWGSTGV